MPALSCVQLPNWEQHSCLHICKQSVDQHVSTAVKDKIERIRSVFTHPNQGTIKLCFIREGCHLSNVSISRLHYIISRYVQTTQHHIIILKQKQSYIEEAKITDKRQVSLFCINSSMKAEIMRKGNYQLEQSRKQARKKEKNRNQILHNTLHKSNTYICI